VMRTKVCFRCGQQKPTVEFYRHPMMSDGRLGKCKDCTKADVRANYVSNREKKSEYERRRNQRPERRAKSLEYQRIARARSPEKYRARQAVAHAVRDGRLRRMPCELCGSLRVQAHHHDYSRPLDIRWLCFKCHRENEHGQVVVAAE
jgi:ribosomal protein S27AE